MKQKQNKNGKGPWVCHTLYQHKQISFRLLTEEQTAEAKMVKSKITVNKSRNEQVNLIFT